MKIIIDTCVILDFFLKRNCYAQAKKILQDCAMEKCEGYITAKSCCDIYYILYKHYHSNDDTKKILNKLLLTLNVLDSTGAEIYSAFESKVSDFEDAFMIATAINNNIDAIVTININDFMKQEEIKIIHPNEWK